MNWFERFMRTPWYFKAFASLLLADTLLFFLTKFPGMFERGVSSLGNIWCGFILYNFFLVGYDNERGIRGIRWFPIALAVITTIGTIAVYRIDVPAHINAPTNPGFYFHWVTIQAVSKEGKRGFPAKTERKQSNTGIPCF